MNQIGQPERVTQNRVIGLFCDDLGYRYLGDWTERHNSNIEEEILSQYLTGNGYSSAQISKALLELRSEADNPNRSLYDNNKEVYRLLRYGVQVKTEVGQNTETIHLVNWAQPELNDFAIAEEVTLRGNNDRRPDLVLYLNGIAISVIELKNSRVDIAEGIRQNLSNQLPEFNAWFFSTVQLVFAGNDSQGLRYGTVGTPEKFFVQWKESEEENTVYKLDKYLVKMCAKRRLIEFLYNFVIFDGGWKKLPRPHQYFGVKAAQGFVNDYKGGIIWHTQGSGKSIVMVLLAKWILENKPNARVVIITDRDELDKQIDGVFKSSGETIARTSSGADLMLKLSQAAPRLICSLVHKFGQRDVDDFEAFIEQIKDKPSTTVGEVFVFVDECHRTQSGKLHRTMKAIMPSAVFIGFTGTPLLKRDKQTTEETFGGYIHTYKFSEGVADGVVLNLIYESRSIESTLGDPKKIDEWFDAKTRGLNSWQKAALREQWGTMQKVLSSRSRMERIVEDIVFDFAVKPQLSSQRGNAMLVVSSIYEACKYFELFEKTTFKGKCALVTSYNPLTRDVTLEEVGDNTETGKQFIYNTYISLLKDVASQPNKSKAETYNDNAKKMFVEQPVNMKLLIVVDMCLTGYDAPSCTYMYLDRSMQDHGLFQAICRTNRLDGDYKDFGHIVDYKNLFAKVGDAIAVYSSDLDQPPGGVAPEVLLQDRLDSGREHLESTLEAMAAICEGVSPPKGELEHIHFFCGNTEIQDDLVLHEPVRVALYTAVIALVRAYANIADDLAAAGYDPANIVRIKNEVEKYVKLREIIRQASGETIDLKSYEADMRYLIDTYIEAERPIKVTSFGDMPLLELIGKIGIAAAINTLPGEVITDKKAVAEIIANNVRSTIIKEHLNDPAYYAEMSRLLAEIIANLKAKQVDYDGYLAEIAKLANRIIAGPGAGLPSLLRTTGMRALYNNLTSTSGDRRLELALALDERIKRERPADWRGHQAREQVVKQAIFDILKDKEEVERLFLVVRQQGEY